MTKGSGRNTVLGRNAQLRHVIISRVVTELKVSALMGLTPGWR